MTETTNPLADQQLDEIQARANAATDGPWERYEEYGPQFYANVSGEYLRGVGDFNFGDGEQAEADETFVRHAAEDVAALVAEVGRLRAELAQAIEHRDYWHQEAMSATARIVELEPAAVSQPGKEA